MHLLMVSNNNCVKKLLSGATWRKCTSQCISATFEFILFACNFMLMIKVGGGILLSASYEDEMRRERGDERGREKLLCYPALNTFTLSNKLCFLIG